MTDDKKIKDLIKSKMLMSIDERASPMGALDVLFQDGSSDLGSLVNRESQGLWYGDLAPRADLQPGHLFINNEDRGIMMNSLTLEHARSTRGACGGIEP